MNIMLEITNVLLTYFLLILHQLQLLLLRHRMSRVLQHCHLLIAKHKCVCRHAADVGRPVRKKREKGDG